MFIVNSFLGVYSLEEGSFFIGWLVMILSVMIFYVNLIMIIGAFFMTPDVISDYLKNTELGNLSKEAFIVFLFVTLLVWSISAVSSLLLIRAVERVSRSQLLCQPAMIYFAFAAFCSLYGFWELNLWAVLSFFTNFSFHITVYSLRLQFADVNYLELSRTVNYRSFEEVY